MEDTDFNELQKLFSDSNAPNLGSSIGGNFGIEASSLVASSQPAAVGAEVQNLYIGLAAFVMGAIYLNLQEKTPITEDGSIQSKIMKIIRPTNVSVFSQIKLFFFPWLIAAFGASYYYENTLKKTMPTWGISFGLGLLVATGILSLSTKMQGLDTEQNQLVGEAAATAAAVYTVSYISQYTVSPEIDQFVGLLIFLLVGIQISMCSTEVCQNPYEGKDTFAGPPTTLDEAYQQCYTKWSHKQKSGVDPHMEYGWCPTGENMGKCYNFTKNEGGTGKLCGFCPDAMIPDGSVALCKDGLPNPNPETFQNQQNQGLQNQQSLSGYQF